MARVHPLEQISSGLIGGRRNAGRTEVANGAFRAHRRALERGGEESGPPVVRPVLRHAARIGNGDVGWQVAALTAEGIGRPGPETGESIEDRAGREEILGGTVRVRLARQGMDEGDLVGQLGEVGNQVADPFSRCAALAERILRPREIPRRSLEGHRRTTRKRFIIPLDQLGFVVPSLELADGSGAEDHDHVLRLRRVMRPPRRVGIRRIDGRSHRGRGKETVTP